MQNQPQNPNDNLNNPLQLKSEQVDEKPNKQPQPTASFKECAVCGATCASKFCHVCGNCVSCQI